DSIKEKYPNVFYLKNEKSNGKIQHWYCYNQMWDVVKNIDTKTVLQMDDDFIICGNFLDTILSIFFEQKQQNANMMVVAPHLWSFYENVETEDWWKRNDLVDGIGLFSIEFLKKIDFKLN